MLPLYWYKWSVLPISTGTRWQWGADGYCPWRVSRYLQRAPGGRYPALLRTADSPQMRHSAPMGAKKLPRGGI